MHFKIKAIKDENYTDEMKRVTISIFRRFMPGKQWLIIKSFGKGNINEYRKCGLFKLQ